MTGGAAGSGGNDFVPASDAQMAELRGKSRVWRHVTQGQRLGTWEKGHGDYKLRCNYCKNVWQGNLFKAQRHFTQLKRCAVATMDVFVDIWNHTDYEFDKRHLRGIEAYMREHDIPDRRATDLHRGSGRGRTGASQSQPQERDHVDEAHKRQRQSTLDEVYDPDGQVAFRDTFLQWVYDSGIPFVAFRRQSWYRHKKALAAMSRGVRPVYPSFKDIGGGGIDDQRGKVAAMLREVRGSFESVGATILSDVRQSRDARPIVNFLAASKRGALLYATVQRDGSVAEMARIVLRRWKAIFRSFPPKDVLVICTDSASNYTSAAKLPAKDPDPEIRRITWLPCATHVANLMLLDIGTGVPWVTETIVRDRALEQFIKSHGVAYHLFRVKSRRRTLVHPVETRFARSLCYYESARRTAADLEVVTECGSFLLAQTGGDSAGDAHLRVREQMRSFHARVSHTTDMLTRDAKAEACAGDEETSRVETLHPYDYVPPPPAEPADTSEQESDSEDLPPGVDKSVERLYYTYGAEPDDSQPHCTVIQESDDDSFPPSGGGTGGPTRRAARGASGGVTGEPSGGATHDEGGRTALPAQSTAEREREHARPACTDDDDNDDDVPLVFHRARMASDRAPPATEGLRRSLRLQTQTDSSTGVRREVFDHLDDITADDHMLSQHTPASAPPGDREQTDLRTSDFPGLRHKLSDTGFPGRGHKRERVGDDVEYRPTEAGVPESTEELHARLDREEEQWLEVLQRDWAGKAVYMAEQQRARDLETGAALPDPGGVEHHDPFAPDLAQTEGHGDPNVPEHGDPVVSDVVLGFRAADTLQPDDVRTEEAIRMKGDSDEHGDGGCGPGVEADDGADTAGRLSLSPSVGPGRLSHGPIEGDDMDLQADDPEEVGGSMSLGLVLWHPSSVAHDVPSEHVEGGGGADEEEEGDIPPDL
ncbi:hypothetical protein CBR_g17891 [Chara braunii]|uniref:BED-type domain-containing protein n=1 Tax=Chara braunii TaxID=69332 RepID=A0A388KVV4_CHABU|nr:hypothetical protein CBR_g17891 [Chara braunii]|eukprot:GBG74177.1 hypothetical protein CBR_g17891 [Chara braunii]